MSFNSFLKNKEVKNAGWLIGGKIAQMALSLVVGALSARYLGPSNYGLISYGSAFVSFFMSFCTLGINSVIIKDFVDNPDQQGETIGSSIMLRILSSILSVIMIVSIVGILDKGEPLTIIVVLLCSISLIFHCFDTLNYWFQSLYKSKVTSMATLVAYIATSVYRVVLLMLGKDIRWFAFATSIDYIVLSVILFAVYKRNGGPKLSFSITKSKQLLSKSYHYILSGMMVAIYGQTDRLMLKQMMDETTVGYYTIATTVCNMWVFVLAAIIDSMYPTILKLYKESKDKFERKNRQLYAVVFYVSVIVSLLICLLGDVAINILYGRDYASAGGVLKVVTWYTAFSYLGVARNAWIVSNDKQKYLKYMYVAAAIINVILNYFLIPLWGAIGAAVASLITQIFTSIILPFFIRDIRPNALLMLEAIVLKKIK